MRPALWALPRAFPMLPLVLLFSTTNALGEEITYRLALLEPAVGVVTSGHAMMMSAVYFGLAHFYGIPSGALGVVMAGFLGWLACRSVLDTKGGRLGIRDACRSGHLGHQLYTLILKTFPWLSWASAIPVSTTTEAGV
jgi:Type II CAAX prenyl endopeptidase Rce1-like